MVIFRYIQLGIILALIGIAAYFVWDAYKRYRAATEGTVYERIWAAARGSGTVFLQGAIAIATAFAGAAVEIGNAISPSIGDTLKQIDPKWYIVFTGALAVLTVLVRIRHGSNDPVT